MTKILIVDDSIFSQKITVNLLKKFLTNVEFYFANDGEEGYCKYKQVRPDFLFLDLLMPKTNGKQLIEMIRQDNINANIIVLSADVQKNIRQEVEAYNIISFINKPFNDEKAQIICKVIEDERNGQ